MADDVYRALARRLDEIPNGFPAAPDGSELRLLASLFQPEEAALAAQMRLTPETAAEIAARTGGEVPAVQALLKGMVRRGLIRAERGEGELKFALMPFVVGIYEMQLGRLDAELAQVFEDYFRYAFVGVLAVQPALHRVIPVEQAVPLGIEVLPFERASQYVDEAAAWGVVDCICRTQQRLLGHGCEAPLDVCLVLSTVANAYDHARGVRALTREGALDVLRRSEEAGLVHSTSNTKGGVWYICNCCTCCCAVMRGISQYGLAQSVAHSAFWTVADEALCSGCEACLERCRFGALRVEEGVARVDHERCLGCGQCSTVCPSEALHLERRPEAAVPDIPADMQAWLEQRAADRGIDLGAVQ
ncbi:MAG TPA: 4Fe-4S binding protein [Anaerolineae bacterium]|nr:4Fe-4S binding protein [Anaerolineae bacterium]HOQ98102.1 4Fe-4S binding protein [Anaerolineae bacterium]HPL26814.1 4Fe-4S binding protein [Anaerolineae bacterium]